MKKVIKGKELREKMNYAINMLCDTVKTTLGPKGSNVIIDHSSFSPFITNDGVTIAENIESDDQVINTILHLAKEASLKTNEVVGDGTTTTLVLLQSIYNNGLDLIDTGVNPMSLKNDLNVALNKIVEETKKESIIPNELNLRRIACVSGNDEEIGNQIADVFLKVKNKKGIFIKEGDDITKINYLNGYIFDTSLASPYFFKEALELNYSNALILLIDDYLSNLEVIARVINDAIIKNNNLVIMAKDYSEDLVNEIVSLNLDSKVNIILLKNSEYGNNQLSLFKDLEIITGAKIVNNLSYIDSSFWGTIKNININKEDTTISFEKNSSIASYVTKLKKTKPARYEEFGHDFIDKRIAMFENGMAEILVGDKTLTARREKKMRYDDALCAITAAQDGILPGGGICLLKITDNLKIENNGFRILKDSLKTPFEQIIMNAGLDSENILKKIKFSNYKIVYNLNNLTFENVDNTEIVDSTSVVVNSLISAVSIASMLLTTTSIVINEYSNNLNKINDYNEL